MCWEACASMAIYCSNLFLYPSNTIDRASTVSGKSMFRCEVMIWRALNALKCLPNCRQQRKLPQLHASGKYAGGSWVKVHRPMTHMTHPKNWPIWPMTHRPIVYSSVVSVRPTVSISAHKPTDLGLRYFACVLVMVVDRLGLIVEVIGQG